MRSLRVLGMDPSMSSWGLAGAILTPDGLIDLRGVDVIQPVKPKGKQQRVNSADLLAADQLFQAVLPQAKQADAVFVEVPHSGGENFRSTVGYGMVLGLLGALRASGIPFFEVTPSEVKLAACGSKTASKVEMIGWGLNTYPNVAWPTHNGKISMAKAEHCADAAAAIHAGVKLDAFQQMLGLLKSQAA